MNTNNLSSHWTNGFAPLSELHREMDRLFDDYRATPATRTWRNAELDWAPACDVEEEQNHYLITLDIPGVQKDQIKLEVIDNQLTISGERRFEQKNKTEGLWYSERRHGKFTRSFTLPAGVDGDKAEAHYQNGTLRVYVPKAESAKPRQIKINSGNSNGASFFGRLIGQSLTKEKDEKHSSNNFDKDTVAS